MKTTSELRLERLSTRAATAGEQSVPVIDLITYFNAYFEGRCPVAGGARNAAPRVESAPPVDANDSTIEAQRKEDAVKSELLVPPPAAPAAQKQDTPHRAASTWRGAARAAFTGAARRLYTLGYRATLKVLKAQRRVHRLPDRVPRAGAKPVAVQDNHEAQEEDEEDAELAVLLRLAVELEDAAVHAAASRAQYRAHKRQLIVACARLNAFGIRADASAASRRMLEQLQAIVSALKESDRRETAHAWV